MVGDYRIEGLLGSGGMGTVYAAIHPLIGKKAAIKVIRPQLGADADTVERFIQEARAVNAIGHMNTVDVFAFGVLPDQRVYLVMELLSGETLAERLERGPLPMKEAVPILDQVCRALTAAHAKGIVHRDLKPENIFLVKQPEGGPLVKLLDFGIAKLTGEESRPSHTKTGAIVGTPIYLSPEQARGRAVDARTDIYSLGVVAYETLIGQPPFLADNAADVIAMHLHDTPPDPSQTRPDIPPRFGTLTGRMMAKEVDRRPSLDEIRNQLLTLLGAKLGTATMPAISLRPKSWLTKGRAIVIAAITAVGVGGFLLLGGDRERPGAGAAAVAASDGGPEVAGGGAGGSAPMVGADAAPGRGAITVSFEPATAKATIDGNPAIPAEPGAVRITDLEPGEHVVVISAPGRVPFRREVTVLAGETLALPRVALEVEVVRGGHRAGGGHTGGGSAAGPGRGGGARRNPDDNAAINPFARDKGSP